MVSELDRIREEYARRAQDPRLQGLYSPSRPDVLFFMQTRERATLRMLRQAGIGPIAQLDLFEMGCGAGGILLDLLRWGADPARVHGCDLLPGRVAAARRRLPQAATLSVAHGGALPYPAARFDLVLQFGVLTSILDDDLRRHMAQELWRLVRPGGAVLSYDFRYRGHNHAVRPLHPHELRALLPEGGFTHRRVTLAPPISRRITRWSWLACELLHAIPWLRTHDLVLIQKAEAPDA